MSLRIRCYAEADFAQVVDILTNELGATGARKAPRRVIEAKVKHADNLFIVAEAGANLIGTAMAGYDGVRGWIYKLAVRERARDQGVGAELVKELIARLKALGCVKINLQIMADQPELVKFYQKLGFSVEERISMGLVL